MSWVVLKQTRQLCTCLDWSWCQEEGIDNLDCFRWDGLIDGERKRERTSPTAIREVPSLSHSALSSSFLLAFVPTQRICLLLKQFCLFSESISFTALLSSNVAPLPQRCLQPRLLGFNGSTHSVFYHSLSKTHLWRHSLRLSSKIEISPRKKLSLKQKVEVRKRASAGKAKGEDHQKKTRPRATSVKASLPRDPSNRETLFSSIPWEKQD